MRFLTITFFFLLVCFLHYIILPLSSKHYKARRIKKQRTLRRNNKSDPVPTATTTTIVASKSRLSQTIPKIIHQFWTGSKSPPLQMLHRCRRLHPSWKYMLWTDNNISTIKMKNKKVYDCQSKNGKSDVFRYEILSLYGGVYLDADTLCRRPLDNFLNQSFLVGYHHYHNPAVKGTKRYEDKFIATGVLGATPKHTVIENIIKTLNNDPLRCKGAAWKQVGPKVVTDALKATEIAVQPFHVFVPYHFTESIDKELTKAKEYNSYTVNLWGTTLGWSKLKKKNLILKQPDSTKSNLCKLYPNFWQNKKLEKKFIDLLLYVDKTLSLAFIDYSIAFGTALGYKRLQKLIPWDDDVDIVLPKINSSKAKALIKKPYCTHHFWGGWKLFRCDSPNAGKYPWKYPFIDVFDNGDSKKHKGSAYSKFMFPSIQVTMHGLPLRGPRHLDKHLAIRYGNDYLDKCVSPHWDHATEKGKKRETHKCENVMKQCFSTAHTQETEKVSV